MKVCSGSAGRRLELEEIKIRNKWGLSEGLNAEGLPFFLSLLCGTRKRMEVTAPSFFYFVAIGRAYLTLL